MKTLKLFLSSLLAVVMIFGCFGVIPAVAEEPLNILFRDMDSANELNAEGDRTISVSEHYIEGTGAAQWTYKSDRTGGLYWYVYDLERRNRDGIDVTGAQYIMFDLYVSNVEDMNLGTGDCRLGVRDNTGDWNNNCTQVTAANLKAEFQKLKTGWNHVVLPLEEILTPYAWAFRLHFLGGSAPAGFYIVMDDIRFVNKAYLDSTAYAETMKAKSVAMKIDVLTAKSSEEAKQAAYDEYKALSEDTKKQVPNFEHLKTVFSALQPMRKQFRSLDDTAGLNMEGDRTIQASENYIEGKGAAKFTYNEDRTGLYWYIYCNDFGTSAGLDISGATHITFDFYVSDIEALNISSGALTVRNQQSTSWDSSVTEVAADDVKTAFSNLKAGWNHIVLPVGKLKTSVAWAVRLYFPTGKAKADFYSIVDDVCFVNEAYLESDYYKDAVTAKDVAAMIGELTDDSTKEQISAARAALDKLSKALQAKVCNTSRLTTLENGKKLHPDKVFSKVPENDLRERVGTGDDVLFTIANLNDLHYSVNNYGQEKQVFYDEMQWLADHKESDKIKMVMQLGDMTSGSCAESWAITRTGFDILKQNEVPYAAIIGNHDYGNNRSFGPYERTFPFEQESTVNPYYTGSMKANKIENSYYCFNEGDQDYMILALECYPTDKVIEWADTVIKDHPDHKVLIYTHCYLTANGNEVVRYKESEALAAGFDSQALFDGCVYENDNVIGVLCAHNGYGKLGAEVGVRTDLNKSGKTVYQFLVSDPQGYDGTYGGMGFVWLMKFKKDGSVTCEYVTTRYDKDFGVNSNYEFTFGEEYDPVKLGDVDGNNQIAANDALLALQHSVGKITLTGNALKAADVDGKEGITANDALKILQFSVGKIKQF